MGSEEAVFLPGATVEPGDWRSIDWIFNTLIQKKKNKNLLKESPSYVSEDSGLHQNEGIEPQSREKYN